MQHVLIHNKICFDYEIFLLSVQLTSIRVMKGILYLQGMEGTVSQSNMYERQTHMARITLLQI